MSPTDDEVRIYRGVIDPAPGGTSHVDVEGLDGTHPLINNSDTDFAWGYAGAGPSNLARCIVIDTLGKEARCKRCSSGGIDPDSGREDAICKACGGSGWSDVVAMAAPVVSDQLLAPLEQDDVLTITS